MPTRARHQRFILLEHGEKGDEAGYTVGLPRMIGEDQFEVGRGDHNALSLSDAAEIWLSNDWMRTTRSASLSLG